MDGSIVPVLSKYGLRFQDESSRGDNLAAFCPFHSGGQEKTPSLYVYIGEETNTASPGAAFCHACQKGWTYSGLLRQLGVPKTFVALIQAEELEAHKRKRRRNPASIVNFDLPRLPEDVLSLYDYCPVDLLKDGFDKNMLRENDVGFDRERMRITFALRDHHGYLVGVSGRTVINEEPRYKVYKSEFYPVYPGYNLDKGKLIWGMDKLYYARMHQRTSEPLIICEGFKAALWVKMAGFTNTVAVLGSAITETQHVLLSRVANEVVLFFDNDRAGRSASWKFSRKLSDIDVSIAEYGTTQPISPDDLTLEQVAQAVDSAVPAAEWRDINGKRAETLLEGCGEGPGSEA